MSKKDGKPKYRVLFQSPKGMHDVLPQEEPLWDKVRKEVKDTAEFYNFRRIDTSTLEYAALFERSLGATSDVVERQMFVFTTKSGDKLVLRPEGTASVARAYIEHGLSHMGVPLKLYYMGPMFRYEQPQAARFRQFHQAGFEIMGGDDDPIYDAQIMLSCYRLLESLKLKKLIIKLNTIGCKTCRPTYRKKLIDYYAGRGGATPKEKLLCKDCRRRLALNPLRLLDCKNEQCVELKKDAPTIFDNLCSHCRGHFKSVLEYVEELKLPYVLDNHLVRGLDYYNRTVFEIYTELEVQAPKTNEPHNEPARKFDFALAGGGRYDYLVEMLGGRETAAVGGSIGIERAIEVMRAMEIAPTQKTKEKIFLIHIGDLAKKKTLGLIEALRDEGISAAESLGKESLKGQLRAADKGGSPIALIFGQKEALEDSIIIRDLRTGAQETVPLHRVASEVKRRLK